METRDELLCDGEHCGSILARAEPPLHERWHVLDFEGETVRWSALLDTESHLRLLCPDCAGHAGKGNPLSTRGVRRLLVDRVV